MINSSRVRLQRENEAFAASIPEGARVLDAGSGEGPYRDLFTHAHYESADIKGLPDTTYACDLASIPVADQWFDFVVFNQVMEHVRDPPFGPPGAVPGVETRGVA